MQTGNFNVYPNPVSDVLWINSSMEITGYDIYDAGGSLVVSQRNTSIKNSLIDVKTLKPATYYLRFYSGDRYSVRSFVKQ